MISAVLDTNVLVSALITKKLSAPLQLYNAFIKQQFLLITSLSIISEVDEVVNRKNIVKYHKLTIKQRKTIIEQLIKLSYVVSESITSKQIIIERDSQDDKFLHAAFYAQAGYIVSGDHHLLDIKEYKGIKIITPNDFLAILMKEQEDC